MGTEQAAIVEIIRPISAHIEWSDSLLRFVPVSPKNLRLFLALEWRGWRQTVTPHLISSYGVRVAKQP
jgi:hypothetical protein